MYKYTFQIFIIFLALSIIPCSAQPISPIPAPQKAPVTLYLSADFTGSEASGNAIKQGLITALAEIHNQFNNHPVKLKILDHRGSTTRAKKHLYLYLSDPTALVLFCGLHSPPLLENREFINKNNILVLDPWAAAAPITRPSGKENWIFRLSIDDSKAGFVITEYATEKGKITSPALLLENTGWGKSNKKTMTAALSKKSLAPNSVQWFNWGLSKEHALVTLKKIKLQGADAIFLVANANEGKVFASAMATLPPSDRLPIYSHWGITGGDFPEAIPHSTRKHLSLNFIQTRFSFLSSLSVFQQQVFNQAKILFPDIIKQPADIKAPTVFIHTYDLYRILIATIKQSPLTGNIHTDRVAIRNNLENLKTPVQGLIKTYQRPFSPFTKENLDAHEALGIDDYVMTHYGEDNEILLNAPQ